MSRYKEPAIAAETNGGSSSALQGYFCNSTVECNITILQPSQDVVVNNLPMTFNTAFYNFTLDENQTSVLGRHSTIGICTWNSTGFSTFTFDITPTGEQNTDILGFYYIIWLWRV